MELRNLATSQLRNAVTRRDFGKGLAAILAAGVAPSLCEASTGGLRRGLAARLSGMAGEVKKGDVLPAGYTAVEWIMPGSNSNYIKTNCLSANNRGMYVAGTAFDKSNACICGAGGWDSSNRRFFIFGGSVLFGWNGTISGDVTLSSSDYVKLFLNYKNDRKVKVVVNGEVVTEKSITAELTPYDKNILLFALFLSGGNVSNPNGTAKIRKFNLSEGDEDLIRAVACTDDLGKPQMYDFVGKANMTKVEPYTIKFTAGPQLA